MRHIIYLIILLQFVFSNQILAKTNNKDALLSDSIYLDQINQKLKEFIIANNADSVMYYYNASVEYAKNYNLKKQEATSYYYLGFYYSKNGLFTEAFENNEKAIQINREIKDTVSLIKCLNQKTTNYFQSNDYVNAIKNSYETLMLFDDYENDQSKSQTYAILGIAHYYADDYNASAKSTKKALQIAYSINDTSRIQSLSNNLASCYTMLHLYDSAKYYYNNSYQLLEENDLSSKAVFFNNIGFVNIEEKNYLEAKINLQNALNIRRRLNEPKFLAATYALFGKLYRIQDNDELAIGYYYRAYNTIKSTSDLDGMQSSALKLADLYSAVGDYKNASLYYKEHITLKDSLTKINDKASIEILNRKFDLKEKVKENELLKSENKLQGLKISSKRTTIYMLIAIVLLILFMVLILLIRLRTNKNNNKNLSKKNMIISSQKKELELVIERLNSTVKDLEIANATKEKFFSIIAHDLKNPFGAIKEATKMLNNKNFSIREETKSRLINELSLSAENSYNLLDNLLNWARSQQNSIELNPEYVDIKDLVEQSIKPYLQNTHDKNIKVNTSAVGHYNVKCDINTIKTVIGNIYSNANKFTPENGEIKIETLIGNDFVSIAIKDSGIGMTDVQIDNLFKIEKSQSTFGTNKEKGTGLGLILCHEFIKLNNGNVRVESLKNQGSCFYINIPNR